MLEGAVKQNTIRSRNALGFVLLLRSTTLRGIEFLSGQVLECLVPPCLPLALTGTASEIS